MKITMVSGETINNVQVVPQGLHVFSCRQFWTDLTSSFADTNDVVLGQEQMVGANFASHCQTLK